jgi:hypothetical protein
MSAYQWIVINESAYESFCREDLSFQEEFDIVLSCTTIKHIRNNLRLRTIFDLFYQAFALAKAHKFNYFSAQFLVVMVDIELTRIMDFDRESYRSDSSKLFDYNEEYGKLCTRVSQVIARFLTCVLTKSLSTRWMSKTLAKISQWSP